MSGPKSSRYTLTNAERRKREEERRRREEERRKREEERRRQQGLSKIKELSDMAKNDKYLDDTILSLKTDEIMGNTISQYEKCLQEIKTLAAGINNNSTLEIVRSTQTNIEAKFDTLTNLKNRLKSEILDAEIAAYLNEQDKLQEVIGQTINTEDIINQLSSFTEDYDLPNDYVKNIENIVKQISNTSDQQFLNNIISLTVNPLIEKIQSYIAEQITYKKEFDDVSIEYAALCDLYCHQVKKFPCSLASIEAIKEEIKQIKSLAAEHDEQAYIKQCMDEVMEEMGYAVLGDREVTKQNGTAFRNELYQYNDDTAINITYSSNGSIAMELGGLDNKDRLPDAFESAKLCDSMNSFCRDFAEIEKRLREKGVVVAERISVLPVSAEYAQIINTSDYNMHGKDCTDKAKSHHQIQQSAPKQSEKGK